MLVIFDCGVLVSSLAWQHEVQHSNHGPIMHIADRRISSPMHCQLQVLVMHHYVICCTSSTPLPLFRRGELREQHCQCSA